MHFSNPFTISHSSAFVTHLTVGFQTLSTMTSSDLVAWCIYSHCKTKDYQAVHK